MADLEWGLTERGQMAASDLDVNTLSDIVWAIKKLTVNGEPLVDVLKDAVWILETSTTSVLAEQRAAVLRALVDD